MVKAKQRKQKQKQNDEKQKKKFPPVRVEPRTINM